MIVEKACWERGCACYDHRLDEGVEVTLVQREWVGLTDEEIRNLWDGHVVPVFGKNGINPIVFAHAIEAKLKEKNT